MPGWNITHWSLSAIDFNSLPPTQIAAALAQWQLLEFSAGKAESGLDMVRKGKTEMKKEEKEERESWTALDN